MSLEKLVAEAAAAQAALAKPITNPIPKENTGALGFGSPSRPTLRSLDSTLLVKSFAPERNLMIPFSDTTQENNRKHLLAMARHLERVYPSSTLLPQVHDLFARFNAEFASTAEEVKLQEILGKVTSLEKKLTTWKKPPGVEIHSLTSSLADIMEKDTTSVDLSLLKASHTVKLDKIVEAVKTGDTGVVDTLLKAYTEDMPICKSPGKFQHTLCEAIRTLQKLISNCQEFRLNTEMLYALIKALEYLKQKWEEYTVLARHYGGHMVLQLMNSAGLPNFISQEDLGALARQLDRDEKLAKLRENLPRDKELMPPLLPPPRAQERASSPTTDWKRRMEDRLDRVMDALEERERARPTRLFQERPYRPQFNGNQNKKGGKGQFARHQDRSPSPRPAKKR